MFIVNDKVQGTILDSNIRAKPVIVEAPGNPTETIENIEEDSHLGIVMVIIDKSQTKGLAIVPHQAISERDAEEAQPDLKRKEIILNNHESELQLTW